MNEPRISTSIVPKTETTMSVELQKKLFLFGFVLVSAKALSLPKYFSVCPQRNPGFDECALQSAKDAIPHIIQGEKSLKIPNLSPLHIPWIQVDASDSLQINLTELDVRGLEKSVPISLKGDFDKKKISIEVEIPEVVLEGRYSVNGKVLVLPIQGEGPGTFKFYDGKYRYSFDYEVIDKNGVPHGKITHDDFGFDIKKADIQLSNLFNGDKALGDQMNKFLNENWDSIVKDFGHVIGDTIATISRQIFSNIFDNVPFNEFFSD